MSNEELTKEFYPDAYVVPTEGGWLVRGTMNGLRFNRLHAEPTATPESAWDATIERMNQLREEPSKLDEQARPIATGLCSIGECKHPVLIGGMWTCRCAPQEPSKLEGRAACDDPLCFGDCHPIRKPSGMTTALELLRAFKRAEEFTDWLVACRKLDESGLLEAEGKGD